MRFITAVFLLVTSFAYSQWTPYNVNMEVKGKFQADKQVYIPLGSDSGKVLMCVNDSTGLGEWRTISGGGTVDTLTLPFYHSITGITDTSLSWNKLTGLKDTVEFHIQGYPISNNFWNINGNSGTNPATNFIGTTDSAIVRIGVNDTARIIIDALGNTVINHDTISINGGKSIHNTTPSFSVETYNQSQYFYVDSAFRLVGFGSGQVYFNAFEDSAQWGISGTNTDIFLRPDGITISNSLIYQDGTEGAGKVLTSDANGLASWQTLALTDTATLNFGSISANGHEVLTMTVTGAALSDVVSLGIPNASMNDHASFVAWVSSANTVSVKCFNFDGSNFNPAAGLFTVKVFK